MLESPLVLHLSPIKQTNYCSFDLDGCVCGVIVNSAEGANRRSNLCTKYAQVADQNRVLSKSRHLVYVCVWQCTLYGTCLQAEELKL